MTLDQVAEMTLDQICDGGAYPSAGDVKNGIPTGLPGVAGTYPTTETSQASQLATDVAEVTSKRHKIQNDGSTTILGVSGTLDIATDNPFVEY